LCWTLVLYTSAFAQSITVSGKITGPDKTDVSGASIYLPQIKKGALSDTTGYFKIEGIKPGQYHLHFSMMGYQPEDIELKLGSRDTFLLIQFRNSNLELSEIIVESEDQKISESEQSQTITVITRNFIQKFSTGTLVNSLERLPGISAINTGVGISKPVIRGLSFNRVLVLENGIRQEGQQWGADHGLEIDAFNADRIEIIKGPASLLYGSDAIGGVISIRPAAAPQEGHFEGQFTSVFRSNNSNFSNSLMVAGNIKGWVFRARATTQDFGDYSVPADSFTYNRYVLPVYDNKLKNTAGKERNIALMAGVNKSWGFSHLTFTQYNQEAGFFVGAFGIPRTYALQPDGDTRNIGLPNQTIQHTKLISNNNIIIGRNWLETDLGFQRNIRTENALPHAHGFAPLPEGTRSLGLDLKTFSLNSRYHLENKGNYSGIIGISTNFQDNKRSGYEFVIPDFQSINGGIFGFVQYKYRKTLVFNGGLRGDAGNLNISEYKDLLYNSQGVQTGFLERTPAIERSFSNLSGSAGLAWTPSVRLNIKFNLASDFRYPTAPELASNGIHHGSFRHEKGSPNLDPERGWQADFNCTLKSEKGQISLTPFYSFFTNYIYLRPTGKFSFLPEGGQIYQYTQSEAVLTGGEFYAEYHIIKALHLSLTGEYVFAQNFTNAIPLPLTPPLSFLAEAEYTLKFNKKIITEAFFNLSAQSFAEQNRVDRNEKVTPGYQVIQAVTGVTCKFKNQEFRLIVQVQNAANAQYMNHLSRYRILNLPEPGRNLVITLSVPFQKTLHSSN